MSEDPIRQARALLAEMKAQATSGAMIPVRVPGQIDAIDALLTRATEEVPPVAADSSPSVDDPAALAEKIRHETAKFISDAVHEMRIPLTSIRGYADMLGKGMVGELDAQQAEFMAVIRANVLRMDHLIADVNDLSKMRAGVLFMEPRMDLAKNVLLMAEKETSPLAEERGQTLLFDVPDGLPLLNADGARIAQALSNLIRNALLYSPEAGTVTVTASAEGGALRVAVQDNGIGMTAEEQTHLGEPFWRSDHEVVRAVKAHGLGYAIAKGLIELMGGAMFYETAFEQGSTFGFTLPGAN